MNLKIRISISVILALLSFPSLAQDTMIPAIQSAIAEHKLGSMSDVQELIITDQYTSRHNLVKHIYLSQSINGIRISNSSINAAINASTGEVIKVVGNIIPNPGKSASGNESFDLEAAVNSQLMSVLGPITIIENTGDRRKGNKLTITLSGDNYSHKSVAEKVYFQTPEDGLKLAWSFDAEMPDHTHWYHYIIDAQNGDLLAKYDWTLSCKIEGHAHPLMENAPTIQSRQSMETTDGSGYLVYNLPIESPNHGERTLEIEPALEAASPFGWHDDDGVEGPDYTYTRGNNVHAYEDVGDSNSGESAEGGVGLDFEFDYDPLALPSSYQEAAITNLFFTNNKIHDIMHMYGFDESSGNFQETNYQGDGFGNDYVLAEAQDGGGSNNANFATPPDGQNPRMQMYLWETGGSQELFEVNAPASLEGAYASTGFAVFGPEPTEDITANLVLVEDNVDASNDGCQVFANGAELEGAIALLYRGNCNFTVKVINAQNAGAVACVVINNEGGLFDMGGTDPEVAIPSIMITQADGQTLVDALNLGESINATINAGSGAGIKDGSFDNGVVIHEYAHGISTRLTGGPSNADCLFNDEQMGEGWSDFYGIALTANGEADNPVNRPMATFAVGEPINGIGLRPAPYDTSFTVNAYTYGDIANNSLSQPHGIGFVWATMLWDLYWALVDEYGFDPDLYAGTGGNNMAIQLVTDGLKLQPCQPGFVDGRDAILLADELLYDGANQCLIWATFAKRGLGYSADQGSSQDRYDGEEAFDLPPICLEAENPPTAQFSISGNSSCTGFFQFTDESFDLPQFWLWDFGDGETSTEQNPSHVYAEPGVYTVSLTVTNNMGEDTELIEEAVVFEVPTSPSVAVEAGCIGDIVSLTASGEGTIVWTDENENTIAEGESITVELGDSPDTYYAASVVDQAPSVFVGPVDGSIGLGANHATAFTGTVDFEAYQPLTILSAWVESGAPGTRVISLWNSASGTGEVIDQISVDIDFTGGGTIELGFEIDSPGTYSIGLNQANLFRNENGTNYPYTEEGLFSIIGSSAGPDYYYYFYNLEVDLPDCVSEPTEVVTEVLGTAEFDYAIDGLTVNFTDLSTGANSWSWDFGDGEGSIESDPEHTYENSGTYTVTLTINGLCTFTQEILVMTVGIEDNLDGAVMLSPNPASDYLQVQIPEDASYLKTIQVVDVSGRMVMEQPILSSQTQVDLSALSSGTYVLQLLDDQRAIRYNDRVVIAH